MTSPHASPLVVDLDHTLLHTDTLLEQFVGLFFRNPWAALLLLGSLLRGRAAFKARLSSVHPLDARALPYREALIAFLTEARDGGRSIHLVTAADRSVADAIAQHAGLFDTVEGSDGISNLKGGAKAAYLKSRFPDGFSYAGDSRADLKVWAEAESIVLAGVARDTAGKARRLGKPVEAEFHNPDLGFRVWRKALRLHQWAKNLLVFAPLFLAHKYTDPQALLLSLTAFVSLGLMASATYLINDLSDLPSDRLHRTKRFRPLARGDLSIETALVVVPALMLTSIGIALAVSPALLVGLLAYAAITLGYTFYCKRQALLDVVTLAVLYTLRIGIGTATIQVPYSVWLLTFSLFFFFSISLAKRYAEIHHLVARDAPKALAGRGYRTDDAGTVLALGVSSSVASVLIVVLYLMEEAFPSNVYASPHWLWVAPFVLTLWAARIWLIAGRGELDEDPVAFAIKDRVSWGLGGALAIAFILATAPWR